MIRFAIIAQPLSSHFQPLENLAIELIARGHSVTFFHQPDARRLLHFERIKFHAVGQQRLPTGKRPKSLPLPPYFDTLLGQWRSYADMAQVTQMLCEELPAALREDRIDALICDQMEAAGGLVAESLGLPFVSIACALPVNREDTTVPLAVLPYSYERSDGAHKRYARGARLHDWVMKPLRKVIARQSVALGLPVREKLHECLSPLAQISQTVLEFDFPRPNLPPWFHEVGPLRRVSDETNHLPYTLDNSRPFVVATFGSQHGSRMNLFKRIAQAGKMLDAQLLVVHCGGLSHRQSDQLLRHGATWVTDSADQAMVLQYADVLVTHGDLDIVLEAVVAETPILALPIAADQPGVAARVAYSGSGVHASRHSSSRDLAEHLRHLLENQWPELENLADAIHLMGGTERAADIVESVIPDRSKLYLVSSR